MSLYLKPEKRKFWLPWQYQKYIAEINRQNRDIYQIERVRRMLANEPPIPPPNIYELG